MKREKTMILILLCLCIVTSMAGCKVKEIWQPDDVSDDETRQILTENLEPEPPADAEKEDAYTEHEDEKRTDPVMIESQEGAEETHIDQDDSDELQGEQAFLSLYLTPDQSGDSVGKHPASIYCEASWEYLTLSEENEEMYPALAQALAALNENTCIEGKGKVAELCEHAEEALSKETDLQETYNYTDSISITRADTRSLSILFLKRENCGKIESEKRSAVNLSPQTGRSLQLSDVFTDVEALPSLLAESLLNQYGIACSETELRRCIHDAISDGSLQWCIGYQNVTFYFDQNTAPFDLDQSASVAIWFREHPELVRSKFREEPEQFALYLAENQWVDVDLDSRDGKTDRLCPVAEEYIDEFGNLSSSPNLWHNENADVLKMPLDSHWSLCWGTQKYQLLHLGDGKNYIYIGTALWAQGLIFQVYDLDGYSLVEEWNGTSFHEYDHWADPGRRELITDPNEFHLDTRTQMLSFLYGTRTYFADPDTGLPVGTIPYYEIKSDFRMLTAKQPLEVSILPSEEKDTIPAGMVFRFLRTDNKSYVDFELEDGRECRVYVESSGWPPMINGESAVDYFDGIAFAG